MAVSSRMPGHCSVCAAAVSLQDQRAYGEAPCPSCGTLLWFRQDRGSFWLHDAQRAAALRKRVQAIVGKNLGVKPERLTDSSSFVQDIGADTLDIVELVMQLEEAFAMAIPDKDAEKILTIGDLVDYLARHLP